MEDWIKLFTYSHDIMYVGFHLTPVQLKTITNKTISLSG